MSESAIGLPNARASSTIELQPSQKLEVIAPRDQTEDAHVVGQVARDMGEIAGVAVIGRRPRADEHPTELRGRRERDAVVLVLPELIREEEVPGLQTVSREGS